MPLHYFDTINTSTNDFIRENTSSFKGDFSGVYTFNQTEGKGLRDNKWIMEPYKNIAMTFCLTHKSLSNISLSFWVACVIRDFIEKSINIKTSIKWPNDILVNKKKVCGVLIEKFENTFIIGIGINVLQKDYTNLPKASSLLLLSPQEYSLPNLVMDLMGSFNENFHLLTHDICLLEWYNSHLFGKDKVMTFIINEVKTNGIIRKVDENGLLWIELENNIIKEFRIKEIKFLY